MQLRQRKVAAGMHPAHRSSSDGYRHIFHQYDSDRVLPTPAEEAQEHSTNADPRPHPAHLGSESKDVGDMLNIARERCSETMV